MVLKYYRGLYYMVKQLNTLDPQNYSKEPIHSNFFFERFIQGANSLIFRGFAPKILVPLSFDAMQSCS